MSGAASLQISSQNILLLRSSFATQKSQAPLRSWSDRRCWEFRDLGGDQRDIPEGWILTPADLTLVMAKGRANRLGFAVLLLFYRAHGRFPAAPTEIEPQAVDQVARQIGMGATPHDGVDLAARTWKRHRAEIRALFGYREATVADAKALEDGLRDQAATVGAVPDRLVARLEARCRGLAIEPPSADRVERIVRAAIHARDERLYARLRDRL